MLKAKVLKNCKLAALESELKSRLDAHESAIVDVRVPPRWTKFLTVSLSRLSIMTDLSIPILPLIRSFKNQTS